MAIKSMGHYQGEVEEINIDSNEFKQLHEVHQSAIQLSKEKEVLKQRIDEIDLELSNIRDALKLHMDENEVDWAWIWNKKSTRVKWKEEFVKALGQKKANEITKNYKTKVHPQVGIRFIDPIPDSIVQIKSNPPKFPVVKHKLKIV